jgi:hypothetical protein
MRAQFFTRVALVLSMLFAMTVDARSQFGRQPRAEGPPLIDTARLDQFGLVPLRTEGHEFVARDSEDQGFNVRGFTVEDLEGRPARSRFLGSATNGDGDGDLFKMRRSYDAAARKVTLRNSYLRVSATFESAWSGGGAFINITIENTSWDAVVRGVHIQLATLRFPSQPRNFNGDPRLHSNRDAPRIINVASANEEDKWQVLVECQAPARPLIWGFPHSIDKPHNRTYPLIVSTRSVGWLGNLLNPYIDRPLLPGASERIRVLLHVAEADGLREGAIRDYRSDFPPLLEWNDRRSIGMAVLSTSSPAHHSATNPRGWFNDPELNAFDAAEFRRRMIEYARSTVRVSKANDAQGVIVWDIEGQEFPHATSYIGDPRSLPPEVEPVADEFFRVLRDGGLKIGLCIRPQRPVRAAYGGGVEQIEVADAAQVLADKIAYAKKRWGATMFYVDSNGDPNVPFDAKIFEQLLQAHPDVLLIPEHQSPRYYRFGAPYDELRGGVSGTPAHARELYPRSFTVINVADGDTKGKRKELVQAVKSGDVLMFRAWFDDAFNADVKSIYEEAKK